VKGEGQSNDIAPAADVGCVLRLRYIALPKRKSIEVWRKMNFETADFTLEHFEALLEDQG